MPGRTPVDGEGIRVTRMGQGYSALLSQKSRLEWDFGAIPAVAFALGSR